MTKNTTAKKQYDGDSSMKGSVIRELRVHKNPWAHDTEIAYFERRDGAVFMAKPLEFESVGRHVALPTFCITHEQTQQLFNELWNMGYRPADGTGNSGHIAAVSYHLEDMRRLVFKEKK